MNVEHIPAKDVDMLPCGADWQSRHLESEKRKAEIRDRIHKQAEQGQKTAKDYFRPAKPTPSIYDSDLKRVAVYARVSTSSEEQISSIENQTLYYTKKIAETENWNLQDIYSDEGKSGTSLRKRDAFKRMMRDAKDQKMDLIICASISRFARNFSDCMTQIAALKTMHPAHPIGVYFETENIYTLNPRFTWASTYKGASFERRQAILKQFIKEVRVGRDYNIEIVLNVPLDEFEEFKRHAASAGRGKNQKNKSQNPQKVGRCTSNAGIVVLDKTAGETISIVPKNAAHAILRC